MSPTKQSTFEINVSDEIAVSVSSIALGLMNGKVYDQGADAVLSSKGASFRSWGELIEVHTVPVQAGKTRVSIISKSAWPTTLIDWGINAENIQRFEHIVRQLINWLIGSSRDTRQIWGVKGDKIMAKSRFWSAKTDKKMTKAQITIPLDIPDVRVLQTAVSERGEIIITIESTRAGTSCRKCGKWITKLHGRDEWVTIRHLPAFGRATYLRYRPQRYQCQDCEGHPTTTQGLAWSDDNSPHSFAYDNHILLQLVNSTVEDVSVKEGVSYDSVVGTLERRIASKVDWTRMADIEVLGLDEIALRKGQGNYVTLVTGRFRDGEIVILAVLPGHEKAVLVEYLRLIPHRILQALQAVCCDLWEAYIEAVREEIPSARLVADRFHVARHYRDAADQIRKTELQRLKKELSKEKYQELHGSFRAFRKNAKDLNQEERKILRGFFAQSPSAKQAYEFREDFTALYEMNLSKKQAQAKIRRWIRRVEKSGLLCFDTFIRLLRQWWQEITNFFVHRENSGFVEGFNNKVKVLKRRCYGIFNLKHLFQRIYLDLSGYRLFAATTIYG